jgi:hypothetical protein
MLRSYRWIVVSLNHPFLSEANSFELLGVEEREIVVGVLSRIETQKSHQIAAQKLQSVLENQSIPLLVSATHTDTHIVFKEGLGVVFPQFFFQSDSVTQELTLVQFLGNVAGLNFPHQALAKRPKN